MIYCELFCSLTLLSHQHLDLRILYLNSLGTFGFRAYLGLQKPMSGWVRASKWGAFETMDQRRAWVRFWIFGIRTPAAPTGSGWTFPCCCWSRIGFTFCGSWNKRYWLLAWILFIRSQTWVGLLVSCWYRIKSGFKIQDRERIQNLQNRIGSTMDYSLWKWFSKWAEFWRARGRS